MTSDKSLVCVINDSPVTTMVYRSWTCWGRCACGWGKNPIWVKILHL